MADGGDRLPTLAIPHGGGPCFFMEPPPGTPHLWDAMAAHLRSLDAQVGRRPAAVLVISAHWEEEAPTVSTAGRHHLLYDYSGFPAHTYQLSYPVTGAPAVAARVRQLLAAAGLPARSDAERGLDHGVFVPFKLIYPLADVSIVQLSLKRGLDAQEHLAIGRALEPLRDEDVLIVGSGMSFHNMADRGSSAAVQAADAFDGWLATAVQDPDANARDKALAGWASAPGARYAHPREEHLLPLMVAAGAAGADRGQRIYAEKLGGRAALSGFRFG